MKIGRKVLNRFKAEWHIRLKFENWATSLSPPSVYVCMCVYVCVCLAKMEDLKRETGTVEKSPTKPKLFVSTVYFLPSRYYRWYYFERIMCQGTVALPVDALWVWLCLNCACRGVCWYGDWEFHCFVTVSPHPLHHSRRVPFLGRWPTTHSPYHDHPRRNHFPF